MRGESESFIASQSSSSSSSSSSRRSRSSCRRKLMSAVAVWHGLARYYDRASGDKHPPITTNPTQQQQGGWFRADSALAGAHSREPAASGAGSSGAVAAASDSRRSPLAGYHKLCSNGSFVNLTLSNHMAAAGDCCVPKFPAAAGPALAGAYSTIATAAAQTRLRVCKRPTVHSTRDFWCCARSLPACSGCIAVACGDLTGVLLCCVALGSGRGRQDALDGGLQAHADGPYRHATRAHSPWGELCMCTTRLTRTLIVLSWDSVVDLLRTKPDRSDPHEAACV
jgi:hypothetical protein